MDVPDLSSSYCVDGPVLVDSPATARRTARFRKVERGPILTAEELRLAEMETGFVSDVLKTGTEGLTESSDSGGFVPESGTGVIDQFDSVAGKEESGMGVTDQFDSVAGKEESGMGVTDQFDSVAGKEESGMGVTDQFDSVTGKKGSRAGIVGQFGSQSGKKDSEIGVLDDLTGSKASDKRYGSGDLVESLLHSGDQRSEADVLGQVIHSGVEEEFGLCDVDKTSLKGSEIEYKTGEIESKTGKRESKTGEIESKTGERESKTGKRESKTGERESKTGEIESKSDVSGHLGDWIQCDNEPGSQTGDLDDLASKIGRIKSKSGEDLGDIVLNISKRNCQSCDLVNIVTKTGKIRSENHHPRRSGSDESASTSEDRSEPISSSGTCSETDSNMSSVIVVTHDAITNSPIESYGQRANTDAEQTHRESRRQPDISTRTEPITQDSTKQSSDVLDSDRTSKVLNAGQRNLETSVQSQTERLIESSIQGSTKQGSVFTRYDVKSPHGQISETQQVDIETYVKRLVDHQSSTKQRSAVISDATSPNRERRTETDNRKNSLESSAQKQNESNLQSSTKQRSAAVSSDTTSPNRQRRTETDNKNNSLKSSAQKQNESNLQSSTKQRSAAISSDTRSPNRQRRTETDNRNNSLESSAQKQNESNLKSSAKQRTVNILYNILGTEPKTSTPVDVYVANVEESVVLSGSKQRVFPHTTKQRPANILLLLSHWDSFEKKCVDGRWCRVKRKRMISHVGFI
ncbi:sericin 1-like [Gigantopelta aegis]|uniref:sericin 1-like n=1 Tax=Gigantopelta aegis TaxID=1735272 RepID=UPI001B888E5C|nr:sericin 1-like [Gigantopelta aegis]